ncbi:hypothetical protein LRS74_29250 [Streptomyces sp. LX-29]|uniref:hypothetical protein n=1 Tax=Streptomyces sp. LX-29 TaxID=2900152 RepID=UPI00240E28D3|nr:hypothetical protein [Streptomyces sp. LX-29]WFB10665.1 hypothetical protein LRS74_29250 [Streptomyces sp. LX-29]
MPHARRPRLAPTAARGAGAVLLTAFAALLALGPAGPAAAHGDTIHFEVETAASDGHVEAVATWENDNDPVTDAIAGTLSAVDVNGRSLGPWKLVPVPGEEARYTTRQELPPGRWTVTVNCGFPDLGRGEATVDVPARERRAERPEPAGRPESAKPAGPARDADRAERQGTAERESAGGDEGSSSALPLWAGAGAVGGGAAVLLVRRRRAAAR